MNSFNNESGIVGVIGRQSRANRRRSVSDDGARSDRYRGSMPAAGGSGGQTTAEATGGGGSGPDQGDHASGRGSPPPAPPKSRRSSFSTKVLEPADQKKVHPKSTAAILGMRTSGRSNTSSGGGQNRSPHTRRRRSSTDAVNSGEIAFIAAKATVAVAAGSYGGTMMRDGQARRSNKSSQPANLWAELANSTRSKAERDATKRLGQVPLLFAVLFPSSPVSQPHYLVQVS